MSHHYTAFTQTLIMRPNAATYMPPYMLETGSLEAM